MRKVSLFFCLFLPLCATTGCRHPQQPIAINLSDPAWTVRKGQAIWTLPGKRSEIAGEVLLATNPKDGAYIQFSKGPVIVVEGATGPNGWRFKAGPNGVTYGGRRDPPVVLSWLWVARSATGAKTFKPWVWNQTGPKWSIRSTASPEAIEGYFDP